MAESEGVASAVDSLSGNIKKDSAPDLAKPSTSTTSNNNISNNHISITDNNGSSSSSSSSSTSSSMASSSSNSHASKGPGNSTKTGTGSSSQRKPTTVSGNHKAHTHRENGSSAQFYYDVSLRETMGTGIGPITVDQSTNSGTIITAKQDTQPLPKLPVPELQGTMEKYLSLVKTVASPQDYAKTKYIVDEFCKPNGQGEELQEHLYRRQQAMDNWANEYWLNDMYLNIQVPLAINSNAAAMFPYQDFKSQREQIRFAAKLVMGLLDFKKMTDTRTLPLDRCKYKEKGQPMCMDQHYRLFSCYRVPRKGRDIQRTDTGTTGCEFIVVACRNQFFRVDIQNNDQDLSEADFILQLTRIASLAEKNLDQSPLVGAFTSQARGVWAEHRERLLEDPINRSSLFALENCLFVVCLDMATLPDVTSQQVNMASRSHHVIHGQGLCRNTANRWMDKTIQVIVSEDGTCGVNMEHSVIEGIALIDAVKHTFKIMGKETSEKTSEIFSLPQPERLQWQLSTQSLQDLEDAKEAVSKLVNDFDLTVFRFEGFGREFIKHQSMSPDAFIQLALQLTYYKIHGCLTHTYESASIRRFRQGRVDNIRANSPSALVWIKAMLGQTEASEEEKLRLLKDAMNWQQDYMLDTILGHGADLHLLGLRETAVELGLPTPEIFKDSAYQTFNYFKLSTSQVPIEDDFWMGYGPVVPDGYGCCYNPQSNGITFSVSCFHSCPDTSSDMFAQSIESSLLQMAELCTYDPNDDKNNESSRIKH